jgi:hypothetical protein
MARVRASLAAHLWLRGLWNPATAATVYGAT